MVAKEKGKSAKTSPENLPADLGEVSVSPPVEGLEGLDDTPLVQVPPTDPEIAKQLADAETRAEEAEEKLAEVAKSNLGQRKLLELEIHNSWEGLNYKKPYWKIKGRFRNDAGELIRLNGKVQVPVGRPGTVPAIIVFKNGVGVTNNHAAARKMFNAMVTPSISSFAPEKRKKQQGITVLDE